MKPPLHSWNGGWLLVQLRRSCAVILLFLFGLFPSSTLACPMCKEALLDPTQIRQRLLTAKAYAVSISVFLCVPLLLIGILTTMIVRAHRRRSDA